MPKRLRTDEQQNKSKRRSEPGSNEIAFATLQQIIRETEGTGKDPLAVMLGRRGGLKGGHARAEKLTKEQLRASAVNAARARWDNLKKT